MWLFSLAQRIINGGHRSRVFKENLAVVGAPADSFPTGNATWGPLIVLDVAVYNKKRKSKINI